MVAEVEGGTAAVGASRPHWRDVTKGALVTGGAVFLLLLGIVGFETVSSTGKLQLRPHLDMVAAGVVLAVTGYVLIALLKTGRPLWPFAFSSVAAVILSMLLFGSGELVEWLPDGFSRFGWAGLVFLAIILARAAHLFLTARARADRQSAPF